MTATFKTRMVVKHPQIMGPHPANADGQTVTVFDRDGGPVLFSIEDYGLAMLRRLYSDKDQYIVYWAPVETRRGIRNQPVYLHRLIARAEKGEFVHHRRANKRDLRRSQLLRATVQQNCAGYRRLAPHKTSQYRGVTLHPGGRWQAALKHRDRNYYLGLHDSEWLAAIAYNKKAREMFGRFAHLNQAGVDLRRAA